MLEIETSGWLAIAARTSGFALSKLLLSGWNIRVVTAPLSQLAEYKSWAISEVAGFAIIRTLSPFFTFTTSCTTT